ncbi:MAG TPA: RNA-binding protein [Thermoplasmatales archaeon]|nr:RNA-binding protein [Thermoplasmatales archaeon]
MALKRRHPVRHKDIAPVIEQLQETLGCTIAHQHRAESAEWEGQEVILLNGRLDIVMLEDQAFLALSGINKHRPTRRQVTVDRGAVPHVLNGADVMAPGITDADPAIQEGDLVWVRNPEGTGIAVGRALLSGPEMVAGSKGKAVKSLHHLGDDLWNLAQELKS